MKLMTSFSILSSLLLVLISLCSQAFALTPEEEFHQLKERRQNRQSLISYFKSEGLVKETKSGSLLFNGPKESNAFLKIAEENADRHRMFAIIAGIQGSTSDSVAKQFAEQMGVDFSSPELEKVLSIHGSNTVGAHLAPALVRHFLESKGYQNIVTETNGVESTISFQRPTKSSLGVIEIKAHGSSTAFDITSSVNHVGIAGGYCDIGMSSRKIKTEELQKLAALKLGQMDTPACEYPIALDGVAVVLNASNPIQSLTIPEIAQVFAGEITNWQELGGPDLPIHIFARDQQSGTWDTFKSKVLKPYNLKLREENTLRFEDTGHLIQNVASQPGGIGFCGLAYIDSTVKALAVKETSDLTAFQPSRLTVKSQDYPLARLLYFYLPTSTNSITREFVKFTMSNEGQRVVDKVGLVGQGLVTETDRTAADQYKKQLLENPSIPTEYKALIQEADRRDTQANLRFRAGSMHPDIDSINNLNRVSNLLSQSGYEDAEVLLIGFADNVGAETANKTLSTQRAEIVANQLRARGIRTVLVEGFGEAMPIADNSSESGRARNRRVEIWLKR